MSFKPEWVLQRDRTCQRLGWEHAETVRRRCPSGQSEASHSEWSARAKGER